MEEFEISEVAKVLSEWNPLGDNAERVNDLDGYKTESVDILFELEMSSMNNAHVRKVVMQVLNEAFDIELTEYFMVGESGSQVDIRRKRM